MEGVCFSLGLWAPGSVLLSLVFAFTFDFVAVDDNPALLPVCSDFIVSNLAGRYHAGKGQTARRPTAADITMSAFIHFEWQ